MQWKGLAGWLLISAFLLDKLIVHTFDASTGAGLVKTRQLFTLFFVPLCWLVVDNRKDEQIKGTTPIKRALRPYKGENYACQQIL